MSYAVLIDHEISELAATELVAELAAELAASFTLVFSSTAQHVDHGKYILCYGMHQLPIENPVGWC